MRAVRLQAFGAPDQLEMHDVPMPVPGPGEALIQVKACGVCYLDVIVRSGMRSRAKLPLTLGHEIAGVVVETGPGTKIFNRGDRVASTYRIACGYCRYCRGGHGEICDHRQGVGEHRDGGYAEFVALPESVLAAVPEPVPFEKACVCGCVVGAVFNAVVKQARVRPGETVVVTGAGGGVGTHAVQLSRFAGAHVMAVTTSADKADRIRALGAQDVILTGRGQDWSGDVKKLTDGRGAEVVIEGVGSATFASSFRALAKGGRLVFVGEISGQPAQFNPALMIYKEAWLTGAQSANAEELTQVLNLAASGGIQPVVGQVLPLADAARAHQLLADQSNFGRVVLSVG
jgi:D-arabinose 1-dehydrogenase-like Zn-dependent alcohol dehydrogenase